MARAMHEVAWLLFLIIGAIGACDEGEKGPAGDVLCGNGYIDSGEVCDGTNLNGATCESLGFGAGPLLCAANCLSFDPSACGASSTCGDGVKNGTDVCDGDDLGGQSCQTQGFSAGDLKCFPNCTGFDTSSCTGQIVCGNGMIEGNEVCDGTQLNGETCESQGLGLGTLACKDDCSGYDTSGCSEECQPQCGTRVCGPDPVCQQSCGECGDFEICTEEGQCLKTCDFDEVTADTVINIDLVTATVSGQIALNGAVMPDNTLNQYYDRGYVRFVHKGSGDTISFPVGIVGIAQYEGTLFAGTYDIIYVPNGADYQNVTPATRYVLAEDVVIAGDWQHNYSLPTVTVGGAVTLNGAQMPPNTLNEYYDRGYLRFTDRKSGDSFSVSLGATGPASFSTTMFAGDYRVTFVATGAEYQNVLPDQEIVLSEIESFVQDRTLSYNVVTVSVSGTVTLNGMQMPANTLNESYDRGYVRFIESGSGSTISFPLGVSGSADYTGYLFAGSYRIVLSPAGLDYQNVLPYLLHELETGVTLGADTTRNFNVNTAEVKGVVTLDGAQMPANTLNEYYERGYVRFTDTETGDRLSFPIGVTGIAEYTAELFTGTYKVDLVPTSADYQNVLPAMVKKLDDALVVNGDLTKHYAVETVSLTATVTLNGAQMPDNTLNEYYDRGWLRFSNTASGDSLSFPLGITGPAETAVKVWKDDYQVSLVPQGSEYQNVLPYLNLVLEKRRAITAASPLSWDVATATVSGGVTLNGSQMPDNTLNEYYDRGWLRFTNKRSYDTLATSFGIAGPGYYSVKLWKGPYDVSLSPNGSDYQNVLPYLQIPLRIGCYDIDADCTADKGNITGLWELTAEDPNWGVWLFSFTQNGSTVTGNGSNNFGQTVTVQNGSRSGDTISFKMQPYGEVAVRGTLLNGCAMTGTFEDLSYGQGIIRWVGERIQ